MGGAAGNIGRYVRQEIRNNADYQAAVRTGYFRAVAAFARRHGKDPVALANPGYRATYGPKFVVTVNEVEVYVDDYGCYMIIRDKGQKVASTHRTEEFIVPGAWQARLGIPAGK